jgi:hypothetical protein
MPLHPSELDSETEITYWRDRVSSLEALVGELLAKNQALRSLLTSAIAKDKSVSENGDSSHATSRPSF